MGHLFVIPARNEPVAVIFRRGPSAWYHVILWNTRSDTFMHGAWFRGRIYEEKCDLSPDGRLLLYFVHQGNRAGSTYTHAWTAISRPPWLAALVLWPHGSTYGGGGRFTESGALWGVSPEGTHPQFPLPKGRLRFTDRPPESATEPQSVVAESDWSGHDQQGHVIFSRGHVLFRRMRQKDLIIADFSALAPDPQPAPDWATRPL